MASENLSYHDFEEPAGAFLEAWDHFKTDRGISLASFRAGIFGAVAILEGRTAHDGKPARVVRTCAHRFTIPWQALWRTTLGLSVPNPSSECVRASLIPGQNGSIHVQTGYYRKPILGKRGSLTTEGPRPPLGRIALTAHPSHMADVIESLQLATDILRRPADYEGWKAVLLKKSPRFTTASIS